MVFTTRPVVMGTHGMVTSSHYLASEAGGYVTGRVLDVDGGLRASNFDLGIPDLE